MIRQRLLLLVSAMAGACARTSPAGDAAKSDSAMAGMAGMDSAASAREIALSAEQVAHGGIRWAPAGSVSAGESGAATLPGQVVPDEDRTARLGAPAEGRVVAVRVSPGDRVRKGQVLVTLQSAAAAMAQADLAKAESALAAKRAQAAYAKSARERADRLLALKALPRQEYEKAVADEQQAATELAQAESELHRSRMTAGALGAGDSPDGVLSIRAPAVGVVLERTAVPGAVVEAGAALMVVTDPSRLWLTVQAPETAISVFRNGASVQFTVPAYPADTFTARVTSVGAGLDAETRTLPVRATVAGGRLKPGMLASVSLPAPTPAPGATAAIVLPTDAVQLLGGKAVVFEVMPDGAGGGHFMARNVETSTRSGAGVVILRGIAAGDVVVVQGAFAVRAAIEKGRMPKMEM